jgi:hypothetical protein
MKLKIALFAILAVVAVVLVPTLLSDNSKNRKPPPNPLPVEAGPEFNFEQVHGKFVSPSSRLNDQQKKEAWKTYKGKRVEWHGEVTEIRKSLGNTSIHLRHLQTTPGADVIVNLRKDQSQRATQVQKGEILTYQGNLSLYGSLFGLTLDEGVIVN